ncbi:MAG: hypothetical protein V3S24_10945 [Candidatus Tectomicrobia bacterium]
MMRGAIVGRRPRSTPEGVSGTLVYRALSPQTMQQPHWGKLSPVLVLLEIPGPWGDFLVCGISLLRRHEILQWDERLTSGDTVFTTSGLKVASLIR